MTFERDAARFTLEAGLLHCEMKLHVASQREARALVEPILDNWTIEAELTSGPGTLGFLFQDAEIIDRAPPTPGSRSAHVMMSLPAAYIVSGGTVTFHVTRKQYPPPPTPMQLSPDAESILQRYRGYREGKEPLLSMAYFCLTVLEQAAGTRAEAAEAFDIERTVLDRLGLLASTRGDNLSARKASRNTQPLQPDEVTWLESTIRQLVLHLGRRETGTSQTLRLTDLPL